MALFRRSGLLAVTLPGLLLLASCGTNQPAEQVATTTAAADSTQTKPATMPTSASFGKTPDGTETQLFTLTNAQGAKATITNYGGTLVSLLVPDKDGKLGMSSWASMR